MLVILPLTCWLVLWFIRGSRLKCWRRAYLEASILWATFAVVVTEVLSFFTAMTQTTVATAWGTALVACVAVAVKSKDSFAMPKLRISPTIVALSAVALVLGFTAIYCAPNNYDSLTYHLPRIEHWINNKSVAHFQIHVLRQLSMNPAAEFLIMQLRILSGADYFSNAVQWFSMIGSLIGVSLIAKNFGASERGQVLAAVICLTIPIGLLESTSTQNDYVAAFWFVCLLLNFDLIEGNAVWTGLSLGLFVLTKATAYFFALPLIVLWAVSLLKRRSFLTFRRIILVAILSIALWAPFAFRNAMTFGTPFVNRSVYGLGYTGNNDSYELKYVVSNIMRTFANEVFTPIPIWNKVIVGAVQEIHSVFHWNASDPKSTVDGIEFKVLHPGFQLQEDVAGNPLHTFLFLIAVGLLIASKQNAHKRALLIYSGSLVAGFLLFSALLKWQPWSTRLLLPLYVAGSAVVACAFDKFSNRLKTALATVMLLCSLPYLLLNPNKTFLGDENIFVSSHQENYFREIPNYYASYVSAVNYLDTIHASRIGVAAEDTSWCEYPLWILLSHNFTRPAYIDGLSVPEWKEYKRQAPDALICFDRLAPQLIELPSKKYRRDLVCDSTGDRVTYHFFGHAIGKTYGHLYMAIYVPEQAISDVHQQQKQVLPK